MSNVCPSDAPVELSNGDVIYPEDIPNLRQLCEIVPLMWETMQAAAAKAAPNGRVAPGAQVPVVGRMPGFSSPVAPGFGSKPGSIATVPGFGQQGGQGGGGGGGFGGGGGGRGAPGAPGPVGPAGPAGPGTIGPSIVKTDGDFTVVFTSPFVPIPGTTIIFTQQADGNAIIFLQATLGSAGSSNTNGQVGIRVDGVDYPLTANLIHTFVGGVAQFLTCAVAILPLALAKGSHTIEAVVRGDAALYSPVGIPVTVQANPIIPLHFAVIHG